MLVSEVLDSAARKLGLIASSETLTTAEYANCLSILQVMLRSYSAEQINVNASVSETFTLTAGTALYTWGITTGDIATVRPNQLLDASILSDTTTYPLNIISEAEYIDITAKTTSGTPSSIFIQYTYPLVNLYLYPVPDAAVTLNLYSLKPFTETASFTAITDTLSLPVNYQEPVIYNLAIRMATEFGVTVSPELVSVATDSYNKLINLNAANAVTPVKMNLPGMTGVSASNINFR